MSICYVWLCARRQQRPWQQQQQQHQHLCISHSECVDFTFAPFAVTFNYYLQRNGWYVLVIATVNMVVHRSSSTFHCINGRRTYNRRSKIQLPSSSAQQDHLIPSSSCCSCCSWRWKTEDAMPPPQLCDKIHNNKMTNNYDEKFCEYIFPTRPSNASI